ncbi:MAG: hypothetical protein M0Q37_09910, partial [Sphaerochaeta sp.]|nr:hypothetical protein [Sphaerochaeta sp.]
DTTSSRASVVLQKLSSSTHPVLQGAALRVFCPSWFDQDVCSGMPFPIRATTAAHRFIKAAAHHPLNTQERGSEISPP